MKPLQKLEIDEFKARLGAAVVLPGDANYVMNVHARWESPDDERCIGWAREFFAKSQPFASAGAYINFLTDDESGRIAFA